MRTTRRAVLAAGAGLVLASTGCTPGQKANPRSEGPSGPLDDTEFEKLITDAKADGKLTFYSTPGEETIRQWVGPYEDEYGIEVEIYRATVSDIYRRFSEESGSGRHMADVVSMSVPAYIKDSVDQGWAVQYRTRELDNLDPKLITAGAGYPMYAVITTIAWNEREVSPDLEQQLRSGDYSVLLSDELKSRVGIVAPSAGGTQLGSHLAIVQDESLGWGFLDALIENGAAVFDSSVPFVANDLSSGEYAVGIGVPDSVAIPRIYDGAPIRLSYPEPAPASMHQVLLSANAPHGAAGRLFLEWCTTLEAQDSLAEITGGLIAHTEWEDQRAITDQPWYKSPTQGIDVAWQDELSLDDSDQFIQEWLDRLG